MRAVAGFTLIELMVVLAILLIAAGLVIPSALNSQDIQAVSAARMIACDLQYAQNAAITSQVGLKVIFLPASNRYELILDDSESTPLQHPINKSDYVVEFSKRDGFGSVNIIRTSFASDTLKFDITGAPNSAGTIRVQAGSSVFDISVATATGKVTVAAIGT